MKTIAIEKSVSGLTANTTYQFRLVAKNGSGTVVGANESFTTPGPTLGSTTATIDYRRSSILLGTVPTSAANEVVSLYAQPFTAGSFMLIATILTGPSGTWAYSVDPKIATTYKVLWQNEVSPTLTISVMPSVTLHPGARGIFVSHVSLAHSVSGRLVRLQRLIRGTWRTVAVARLNRSSTADFHPILPKGRSRLRAYLSAWQAGPGYVAGISAVHVYWKA
jgi:hypothetical protein